MNSHLRQLIIMLVIALVVVGGVVVWYRDISYTSAELASIETKLRTETGQAASAPVNGTSLEALAEDEAFVQRYFISDENIPAFINDLEARGRTRGASVTILSVSKAGAGLEAALALSLTVKGTFAQVMQTIGAIEYAPYALTISSVALVREAKGTWKADLKLSVGSPPPLTTP
jgi:Tfp pilus assembly protein PilO